MENTLTKEQIENWRRIIFIQLEEKCKGAGSHALIMPESEVIEYWKRMKIILEQPELPQKSEQQEVVKKRIKSSCNHANSFTGSKGKYCIDCERYV